MLLESNFIILKHVEMCTFSDNHYSIKDWLWKKHSTYLSSLEYHVEGDEVKWKINSKNEKHIDKNKIKTCIEYKTNRCIEKFRFFKE